MHWSRLSLSWMFGELASASITNSRWPVLLRRRVVETSSKDMPFAAILSATLARIPGLATFSSKQNMNVSIHFNPQEQAYISKSITLTDPPRRNGFATREQQ